MSWGLGKVNGCHGRLEVARVISGASKHELYAVPKHLTWQKVQVQDPVTTPMAYST